jgi:hypothetical protein
MQAHIYNTQPIYSFNIPNQKIEYKSVGIKIEKVRKRKILIPEPRFQASEFSFDDFLI